MGSVFELQVTDTCGADHKELLAGIHGILEAWEGDFSLYQENSPLSKLNRDKELLNPGPVFQEGLKVALRANALTLGKFNIQVQPVLNLIRDSFKKSSGPPESRDLDKLKSLLNPKLIVQSGSRVSLADKNASLSFDGIVKGIAVEKSNNFSKKFNLKGLLLNFSGNMHWYGQRADGKSWTIKAWNPVKQSAFALPSRTEASIASSGPENNAFDEKYLWHHLIDPWTLRPATYWSQATVIGPDAGVCDALSTAVFVSDLATIKKIHENYPLYFFYLVDRKGDVHSIKF